jgi:flavin-dependent dehydrogenase
MPAARFAARTGLDTLFAEVFTEATGLPPGPLEGRLRGFPGAPAVLRTPTGPGWALVGDAGYFKDPLTAHGLTDALRDAELLARSVLDGPGNGLDYGGVRDRHSRLLFSAAEQIAGYRWTLPELRALQLAQNAAGKAEVRMLRRLDEVRGDDEVAA